MTTIAPPFHRTGRTLDELRPIRVQRRFTQMTPGSVLIEAGLTRVLCTASVEEGLPPWMKGQTRGWLTAEYNMLPGSTSPRKGRDRGGKIDGRTTEIQRLIGRSLRSVVNLEALGQRTITVDCDVLQADGGTRTTSITGAFIALADTIASLKAGGLVSPDAAVFRSNVAAISVGIVGDQLLLDLDYAEDSRAEVDSNIVMTGAGEFVEIQGTAEGRTFRRDQFDALLKLAENGIRRLTDIQRESLAADWPLA
jgi:ribonuclease PH